jgi:hypothetical protein
MLNCMKTSIWKYADLSWETLARLKKWFRQDIAREGFTLDNFNNNIKVIEVKNSVNQTIALCPIEKCFIVQQIVNPQATVIEIGYAGDFVDRELARLAQSEGMDRFLIAVPSSYPTQPDEVWVRVISRRVPQNLAMQCGDCTSHSHTALSN